VLCETTVTLPLVTLSHVTR